MTDFFFICLIESKLNPDMNIKNYFSISIFLPRAFRDGPLEKCWGGGGWGIFSLPEFFLAPFSVQEFFFGYSPMHEFFF